MRDIKFRAWIERDKKMYNYEIFSDMFRGRSNCGLKAYLNNDFFIPMQYTGLKDKAGVEIWESDKVNISVVGEIPYKAVIVFKDGGFRCSHYGHIITNKSHEIEVIGNIYEKELK